MLSAVCHLSLQASGETLLMLLLMLTLMLLLMLTLMLLLLLPLLLRQDGLIATC